MSTSNLDIKHQFYFQACLYKKFRLKEYPNFESIEKLVEDLTTGQIDGLKKNGEITTYDIKHDVSSLSFFESTAQL